MATFYFQATLSRVLEGLNCMVWVDDMIYWGLDETDALGRGQFARSGSQVHFFRN